MKKTIGVIALIFFAFSAYSQSEGQSTPLRPGLAVVEHRAKSKMYEIKLKLVANADQGRALDALLLSKQGILRAETDWTKRLCRVEALSVVTPEQLADVVRSSGLEIAKTNQD